jgi:hydrogenase maturation protease
VKTGGAPRRILVVGLGNVLTGDDAVGPTTIRILDAGFEAPAGVEWVDAGTPGMDLASLLAEADAAIVVDSIQSDEPPGTVQTYDRAALVSRPLQPRTHPHAPGLSETLLSLELQGLGPRTVLLVGVVPERVEVGVGLSSTLGRALPAVVRAVIRELTRLGSPPAARSVPQRPDLWWTRSPALAGTLASSP